MRILEPEPRPPNPGSRRVGPASVLGAVTSSPGEAHTGESEILREFQPLPPPPQLREFLCLPDNSNTRQLPGTFHLHLHTAARRLSGEERKSAARFTDAETEAQGLAHGHQRRWQIQGSNPGLLIPR